MDAYINRDIIFNHVVNEGSAAQLGESFSKIDSHFHLEYEVYIFLGGELTMTIDQKVYPLQPYDLLIIRPAYFHQAVYSRKKNYERCYFHFLESMLPENLVGFMQNGDEYFHLSADGLIVLELRRLIENRSRLSLEDRRIAIRSTLYNILIDLKYRGGSAKDAAFIKNAALVKAIDYINENITKELSVCVVAAAAFVSASHLSFLFKRFLNISVMQYVRQKKILHAQNMILLGVSPSKVCLMMGYNDYSTFYRTYKSILKTIPQADFLPQDD
jgi:AraC-like DNA-binding protein